MEVDLAGGQTRGQQPHPFRRAGAGGGWVVVVVVRGWWLVWSHVYTEHVTPIHTAAWTRGKLTPPLQNIRQ